MKNVEDVYPLSPMQHLMLLHTLAHTGEDLMFNQFQYTLSGPLDVAAFRAAWQMLVERHAALRTAFLWEKLKEPLQVVRQQVSVPFELLDWRERSAQEQSDSLQALVRSDKNRAFELGKAPLMRVVLVQLSELSFHLLWSSHHLVIDRWCLGTIYRELFAAYEAHTRNTEPNLEPARSYRRYIQWMKNQPIAGAQRYWCERLSALGEPATLYRPAPGISEQAGDDVQIAQRKLDASMTREYSRSQKVTPGVVVQAAWALALNRLTGLQDVVFGTTVSGRPPDLADVGDIVGSFVNNLPVRARLSANQPISALLEVMLHAQQHRLPHEHVSLPELHQWAGLSGDEVLFDSLFVWLAGETPCAPDGIQFEALAGQVHTAYPVTLSVAEDGEQLVLTVRCRTEGMLRGSARQLVDQWVQCLEALTRAPAQNSLAELEGFRGHETLNALPVAGVVIPMQADASEGSVGDAAGREQIARADLEDLLRNEWCRLLQLDSVGALDNFFDLGGNSLLAAALHASIEAGIRKRVPMLRLFHRATLRDMVDTLLKREWPIKPDLVSPVSVHRSRPAIFCIASPEVNTVGYALLARHIAEQHSVYLVQSPPGSNRVREMQPADVPAVASEYLHAIRQISPNGPYRLIGMCSGAHIAFEMARQLHRQEQPVAFLGLVNTWAMYTVSRVYYLARAMNRARYYLGRLRDLTRMSPTARKALLLRVLAHRLPGSGGEASMPTDDALARPAAAGAATEPPAERADSAAQQMLPSHTAPWINEVGWSWMNPGLEKYSGPVTVFRIRPQQYWRISSAALGWNLHAEHVVVQRLPGREHDDILREPDVREIGARLNQALAQAADVPSQDSKQIAQPAF